MDLQEGQQEPKEPPKEEIDLPGSPKAFTPPEAGFTWLKNLFIIIALLLVVGASFWISFNLGKKILSPVKKEPIRTLVIEDYVQEVPTKELIAVYDDLKKEEAKKPPAAARVCVTKNGLYCVVAGAFSSKGNAQSVVSTLKTNGIDSFVAKRSGRYEVQAGAYKLKKNAQVQQSKLLKLGFSARIIDR